MATVVVTGGYSGHSGYYGWEWLSSTPLQWEWLSSTPLQWEWVRYSGHSGVTVGMGLVQWPQWCYSGEWSGPVYPEVSTQRGTRAIPPTTRVPTDHYPVHPPPRTCTPPCPLRRSPAPRMSKITKLLTNGCFNNRVSAYNRRDCTC